MSNLLFLNFTANFVKPLGFYERHCRLRYCVASCTVKNAHTSCGEHLHNTGLSSVLHELLKAVQFTQSCKASQVTFVKLQKSTLDSAMC